MAKRTAEERFWAKVDKRPDGCWIWTGGATAGGYGRLSVNNRDVYTHRFAYELVVGPISEGKELDHLCRVTLCCNPDHLDPVLHRENVVRGVGPSAEAAAKTHCKRGHLLAGENLYVRPGGWRRCRACHALRARRRRAQSTSTSANG